MIETTIKQSFPFFISLFPSPFFLSFFLSSVQSAMKQIFMSF